MPDNFSNNQPPYEFEKVRTEQNKKKKSKLGIIFCIFIGIVVLVFAVSKLGKTDISAESDGVITSVTAEKSEENRIGNYGCKIKNVVICDNFEGKKSVKITYEFTNNSSSASSFDLVLIDDAYQDGIGLEKTYTDSEGNSNFGYDVKIQPGTTKDVTKMYILNDEKTPVDIEISEQFSFSDKKLKYTVELN